VIKLMQCSNFVSKSGWSSWVGQVGVFKLRCAGRGFVDFLTHIL
jgi:hypothetical protein